MGSWQGEELEKLNPLPSSSREDNKALQGVRRNIRKEMQSRGNTLSPRGSGRGSPPGHSHPEGEEGKAEPQGRLAATYLLQDPGLMVCVSFVVA